MLSIGTKLLYRIYLKCAELHWSVLVLLLMMHFLISYGGMVATDPGQLGKIGTFSYYYLTTVSTVGYGDISPGTPEARLFYSLFLLPGGLVLFTIFLGKAVGQISETFRRRANGMGDYSTLEGALVIIGYQPVKTKRMVQELHYKRDEETPVVLMSVKDVQRDPSWRFVRAESLTNADDLIRAGVKHASQIVVFADTDDLTLTSVLAARSLNKDAHLVCFFYDTEKADLLRATCDAEIIVSASVELVAREVSDPGSARMIKDLVTVQSGFASYSLSVPDDLDKSRSQWSIAMSQVGATLVSVLHEGQTVHDFDPRSDQPIQPGDKLFYLAQSRVPYDQLASYL